ncbi:MAG: hypothetical protein ACKOTA_07110, partial [Solirubrobacterales bacterium]
PILTVRGRVHAAAFTQRMPRLTARPGAKRAPTRTVPGRRAITRVQPPAARERQADPASTVK